MLRTVNSPRSSRISSFSLPDWSGTRQRRPRPSRKTTGRREEEGAAVWSMIVVVLWQADALRELCRRQSGGRIRVIGSAVETLPCVRQAKRTARLTGLSASGKSWLPLAAPVFPPVRLSPFGRISGPDHPVGPPTGYDSAAQPIQPARYGHDEEKPCTLVASTIWIVAASLAMVGATAQARPRRRSARKRGSGRRRRSRRI